MTTGYREIEVRFSKDPSTSLPVGTLAEKDGLIYFEYNHQWLAHGLELSPFTLPLRPGLVCHRDHGFGPVFGLFDDSLPDGWGLLLMDRCFRSRNIDPVTVSILDRLLFLGNKTMGALTYHPALSRESDTSLPDLHDLAEEAMLVYAGKADQILPQLIRAGGSPGGARPKVLVGFNSDTGDIISGEGDIPPGFEHWIIKFSSREDLDDAGPVEYAYARMACAAGIKMEKTRLFTTDKGERFFGIKRFDRRPGNRRYHIHTFGNLVQANFRVPGSDYTDLLKTTSLLTRNNQDLEAACRLMIFNVMAHNRDDHVKNFSFLFDDHNGSWSLAPAYDLTFSRGPGGEHTTTILGEGLQPEQKLILQLAAQSGITPQRADIIFQEVEEAVSRWPEFAALAGVGEKTARDIAGFHAPGWKP
ncbi:type II toxin-antitoxin system HipA family toxin [Desulfomarina sp.]